MIGKRQGETDRDRKAEGEIERERGRARAKERERMKGAMERDNVEFLASVLLAYIYDHIKLLTLTLHVKHRQEPLLSPCQT